MKKLILILVVLFSLPFGFANSDLCSDFINKTDRIKDGVVPTILPYKNEAINVYSFEEELIGHIRTVEGTVSSIGCEELENPTLNVEISNLSVIDFVLDSSKPIKEFNRALGEDILINSTSGFGSAKLGISKAILFVLSLFWNEKIKRRNIEF